MLNYRSTEKQGKFTVKSYPKVAEELSTKKNNFHRQRAPPKKCGRFLMINHVLIDVFRFLLITCPSKGRNSLAVHYRLWLWKRLLLISYQSFHVSANFLGYKQMFIL